MCGERASTQHVNEPLPSRGVYAGVYRLVGCRRHNDTGARRVTFVLHASLSENTIEFTGERSIPPMKDEADLRLSFIWVGLVASLTCSSSVCAEDGGG